jgi:hypothetical protein
VKKQEAKDSRPNPVSRSGTATIEKARIPALQGGVASQYLTGVTADPAWRRCGTARLLTRRRMGWIWERESAIWCFISTRNRASLDLHRELGFDHVMIGASLTRQDDVQLGVPARTRKCSGLRS